MTPFTVPKRVAKVGWSLLLAALACVPVMAQVTTSVTCNPSITPNKVRAEGNAELVADLVLICTGGAPTAAQQNVLPMTFALNANAVGKSRVLSVNGGWSDAFLIIDEPKVGNELPCFPAQTTCSLTGTGNGVNTYAGGASGRFNVYQGQMQSNIFSWSVPFDAPGPNGQRVLRFTNLRFQASSLGIGANISIAVSGTGQTPITINSSPFTVATTGTAVGIVTKNVTGTATRLSSFTLEISELFAGAFKTRTSAGIATTAQNVVGANPPGTESGFYNPSFGSGIHGDLSVAGLADTGTRLRIRLNNVPTDVVISVPQTFNFGTSGQLRLTNATAQGTGVFGAANSAILTNSTGVVTAVYEVTATDGSSVEIAPIPFTIGYLSGTTQLVRLQGDAALAPLPATGGTLTDIPNFTQSIALDISLPLAFTTSTLPGGSVGIPFLTTIQGNGGTSPYTFSLSAVLGNSAPPGLALKSDGTLSGTPTTVGSFSFGVTLRDATQASVTKTFTVVVSPTLTITTASPLPDARAGVPYQASITVSGGKAPYAYSFVGTTPADLTLTTDGIIGSNPNPGSLSGTPKSGGALRFTIQVADSAQVSVTKDFQLTVGVAGPVNVSASKLTFEAIQNGELPPQQSVTLISSSQAGAAFVVTVDGGTDNSPAPVWLNVTPTTGTVSGRIVVSVDQGTLTGTSYAGRIRITVRGSNAAPIDIAVSLNLSGAQNPLDASPNVVHFVSRINAPGKQSAQVLLRNINSLGPQSYTAKALNGSNWITGITPSSGAVSARQRTIVRIDIDSTGLAAGYYRDVIRFSSFAGNCDLPVVLLVAPGSAFMDLSNNGLRFSQQEGDYDIQARRVKILNRVPQTTLNWNVQIIRGGDWLALNTTSGSSTFASPSGFLAGVRPSAASLTVGNYYALLKITSAGAINAPQFVTAILKVGSAGNPPDVEFDNSGVVLTSAAGSKVATTQVFNVSTGVNASSLIQTSVATLSGGDWLTVAQDKTNVSGADSIQVTASASGQNLAAGDYRGEIAVVTGDVLRTINITFIVTDAAGDPAAQASDATKTSSAAAPRDATACTPNRLIITATGLPNNFAVPAGWPTALSADLRDNCGSVVLSGNVVASFTNGDPPLSLLSDDATGTYSATWQPRFQSPTMNVTLRATSGSFPEETSAVIGGVTQNDVPVLFQGGIVHNLDPKLGGLLAPGLVTQVYGANLASVSESTGVVPLQSIYKGTDVLVGSSEAPLYYVSPGQLVVQLPTDLTPNVPAWVVASASAGISTPQQIDIVPVQPGVAAFSDGTLIAQHADYVLVDSTHPAKRGEFLIMYLVGLGATTPAVSAGAPSPGTLPLGIPTSLPTVTIDGQQADAPFAGLTPFGVGLFQINFKVPDSANLNTPLDVVVKQGGVTANVTKLTVVQ